MISVEIDGFLSFWEHFRAFRAEIRTELRKSFRSMPYIEICRHLCPDIPIELIFGREAAGKNKNIIFRGGKGEKLFFEGQASTSRASEASPEHLNRPQSI